MKAQLYLDNRIRKTLTEPFETFAKTYVEKVIPIFSSLEEESQAIADEKYNSLGRYFNPESDDPSDYAEMAWEAGLEHYESMSLMQYNMRLMWISTLYQFWEQQVRKFVFEEVTRTHTFIDKKGNEISFDSFFSRGIDDIKDEFKEFGQDLEKLSSWSKIEELRLLANVIKHGNGWSATRLKQLRSDFFDSGIISTDLLDLYKTTLGERVLNIEDCEYKIYCDAIIQFWNDLPVEFKN
ncbi:hypothetical protein [Petrocella sp. FN5]|uniref:hypothetical protein n=1 Tax=Petrocella sp. FN5 TaxID=3032002 RepID=UPI0023D9B759|nr:hypothetical protein [Petrocella sp. FN5]MDF1616129.1 hypothetical protein [Petrocella sp. FN5]